MFDMYSWADRHILMKHAYDADQAERAAIEMGSAPIGTGVDDDRLAGTTEDEADGPDSDSWSRREEAVESAIGETLAELERRAELIGSAYPFSIENGALKYRGSSTGVYEYCLATSLAPNVNSKKFLPLSINFELLATEVVKAYLGVSAEAVRTGWPSHDDVERPVKFKAMSEIVNQRCGEWVWSPQPPNPDDPTHIQVKDEGVDFIIWLPMLDSRTGKLIILGQCACGENWDQKLNDIDRDKLSQWLNPISSAPYMKAFSVPRHILGSYIFHRCNVSAGITFDRARFVLIAENSKNKSKFVRLAKRLKLANLTKLVFPEFHHSTA